MHRIPELDGLRGVAILMVLLWHFGMFVPHGHAEAAVFRAFEMGWAGVDLFFVLSGYLITTILLKSRESDSYYRQFYIHRFLRIFPLYYTFLAAFLLISLWKGTQSLEQVWYWSYLANFRIGLGHRLNGLTHFWSLAIEEQFYLIWPFIIRRFRTRGLAVLCALVAILSFGLRYDISGWGMPEFLYTFTLSRIDSLVIGALIAVLLQAGVRGALLTRIAIVGICSGSLLLTYAISRDHSTLYTDLPIQRLGYLGFDLLAAGVVLQAVIRSGTPQVAILRSRVLKAFGKYSYGIYVLHVPIALYLNPAMHQALGDGLASSILSLTVGISLSFLAALLSWWILESRFLGLKDRLRTADRDVRSVAVSI